jgi:hypothetical protein
LPLDPSQVPPTTAISKKEILAMRKKLQNKDSLKSLLEGYKPNGSILPESEDV